MAMTLLEQAQRAKASSYELLTTDTKARDGALLAMADALEANADAILAANERDLAAARAAGRREALLDRLALSPVRIAGMAGGLRKVAALPDPVGGADYAVRRPNGLSIEKRRVPIGVVGIIYEARPNVTADAAGLCLKSANACLLRGGSEAIHTNSAVVDCLSAAAAAFVPADAVQLVRDTSRETAAEMMRLNGYLDVLIPRGGAGLIRSVVQTATVPVIETGAGVCHTYVDAAADIPMAAAIVANAKCSRPSVCNACETLLVHRDIAARALPAIAAALEAAHATELRGCPQTCAILPRALPATEEDWSAEYGDYILSVRVVDGVEEAIRHINRYGTHHSECIVTEHLPTAERFLNAVDAAAVYVNASTRFTDGEEFGFGAEIGISTQKLHARGPMGLHELTSVKYVVRGAGQVR
jgi:glutamate-5-semialdehyde dehydrogenase